MITEVQEHAVASEPELRLDSILNHRERFTRMRECFAGEGKLGAETMVGSIFGDQQFAIGFNLGHLTNDSVLPSEERQTARPPVPYQVKLSTVGQQAKFRLPNIGYL